MLMINAMICIAIVVSDLLLTLYPYRKQYLIFILRSNIGEAVTVLLYTIYTTGFIAGRLWWADRESKKFAWSGEARGNHYGGAIAALVQSGVLYLAMMLLTLIAFATMNVGAPLSPLSRKCIDAVGPSLFLQIVTISVVNEISAVVTGISATLLVLQLNLFQERTLKRDADGPSQTTGATFQFAGLGRSSATLGGRSPAQSSVVTRRRASMSMVEGRHSEPPTDTT
ncbi:hypothetical protein FRB94_005598 [Tulasnella sp. JGI-2019a]|nr:hypothetical protein FRB94_005598 [Tulasnella sp. JGI-2019a]KAG9033644.1 hypothetical protein FRB95_014532 [Tulasnella sp. JGI-2019a]